MLGSDEDEDDEEGERGSGASSDEFASDVDFRVKGKSKWDSRSSLERSDYVADSVDESDSEAEGSGSGSEDDSEDDSEGEYMVFRGR